jgi:hypothetical protein
VIGELGKPDVFYITTRTSSPCPDHIDVGFDRDLEEDESFFLACEDIAPAAHSASLTHRSNVLTIILLASFRSFGTLSKFSAEF